MSNYVNAELTILNKDGSHETIYLKEQDDIEANEGGFGVTFASSPSITTFYPYHRIWEYQEINPSKTKERETQHISNSTIGGSVTQVRNIKGNIQI
jgi:hypothetical protein